MPRIALTLLCLSALACGCVSDASASRATAGASKPQAACTDKDGIVLKLLAGEKPSFAAGSEPATSGYSAARCTITVDGRTEDCKLLYAPPGVAGPFLQSLSTYRFAPPQLCGRTEPVKTVLRFFYEAPQGLAQAAPAADGVVPFEPVGMTKPVKIGGREPQFTEEMMSRRVQGLCIVRCTVLESGDLEDCYVVKSLPYADEAVIDAVRTWQMTPIAFKGRPVKVAYTFQIRLKLPR